MAGIFLDEVTLMPESFVNQALSRCSIAGSKMYMTCNPASPFHYIKKGFIEKETVWQLWLQMRDNYALSEEIIKRYESLFEGVFYKRYILGLWVIAEGLIYTSFNEEKNKVKLEEIPKDYDYSIIGIDYGTTNPCVFLYAVICNGNIYVKSEYYYKANQEQGELPKTDDQYYNDLIKFIEKNVDNKHKFLGISIDPSAASFKNLLISQDISVLDTNNDVDEGIKLTASLFSTYNLFICDEAENLIRELQTYMWDSKAAAKGSDKPLKKDDHSPDALRYLIMTIKDYLRNNTLCLGGSNDL